MLIGEQLAIHAAEEHVPLLEGVDYLQDLSPDGAYLMLELQERPSAGTARKTRRKESDSTMSRTIET